MRNSNEQQATSVDSLDFNTDNFKSPTKHETFTLQQVLISGLSENLCRIAPLFDANGNELPPSKKASKILYESQETGDRLKLHRLSALFKQKPAHIVYQEVYAIERPDSDTTFYMKGATQVDSLAWLH